MSAHRPTDNDVSTAEWLADQTQAHQATSGSLLPGAPQAAPVTYSVQEPVYAHRPVSGEDDEYGEVRQRERYGGLNWGAGFFGWLVAAGVAIVLSGLVAASIAALGLTEKVLSTDAEGGPTVEPIAAAAVLFGLLLVAYYTGGYVAGRMSRFDGGKQGVAVWLTGTLLGAIGVGFALLADTSYGAFDQVQLPTMSILAGESAVNGAIGAVAALFASLLAAVVGGKVGCRYHRKVDDAAYA